MREDVLLYAKEIEKSFSGVPVLKKVNLEVKRGEVHALMGENGAGKSTLIKILMGVYPKDGGEIYFQGKKVEINSRLDAQKLGLSVIYQELSLIPTLSVMQNILLGQEIQKFGFLDNRAMRKRVTELMEHFHLKLKLDAIVETLSIAQRQTVEILKALTFDAPLIVMDEPTASLSASESQSLFEIINRLREKGVGILYITHRLEEVYQLADRLTVLRDGINAGEIERVEIQPNEVIRMMIGKELENIGGTAVMRKPETEVLLSVKGLGRKGVFSDISFDVHQGEILGIGGLVGAGRTELIRAIFGADKYDQGEIWLRGERVPCNAKKNIEAGFGFVPEDRRSEGFVPLLSIQKNIALTNYDQIRKGIFFDQKAEDRMCNDAIARLDIRPGMPELQVGNLSGGNQQKVVVGKWLMRDLKVLMVDEPTAGIDIGVKEEIYRILEELAASGIVVIVVSSDLQELLRVSSRILVLRHGRIFREFDHGEVTQEDILMAASGINEERKKEAAEV